MKLGWWQAGLHFEPETDAEREALGLLEDAFFRLGVATPLVKIKGQRDAEKRLLECFRSLGVEFTKPAQ